MKEEDLKKIAESKEIPQEIKKSINKKVYENVIISTFIMALCVLLLVGFKNIWPDNFLVILRTLAIVVFTGTIVLIETAYKKGSGKLAINSIEMIVISLIILSYSYIYIYYRNIFPPIITFVSSILGVYYSAKSIIIIFKERNNYRKTQSDIKKIVEE